MEIKNILEHMSYGPATESQQEAIQFLEKHQRTFGHFIAGKWENPSEGQYFETKNPADGSLLARIAEGSSKDVDAAVSAAHQAFESWSALSGFQRAKYLYALARQIQKESRLFAVLESIDNGKTLRETRDIDIPLVVRHFYHHAGWAQVMDDELPGYEPLGVVGQIIPWNFPLLMLSWKIAPALAMGNTVVLKPAEFTPLTALLFGEICQRINLPAGVINIVTGHGSTGADIVSHPKVKKIAFTGSTEVGKHIRRETAGTGKKLSLELGGKSPFIVFDDADLDSAVEGIVDAIWFNQGQVCCAGSRLLVQEGVADKLYQKIKTRMETLRVGNPLDKTMDIGAIVDTVQYQTIDTLVKKGIEEGNDVWQPVTTKIPEGCFYPPTILLNVSPASIVAQEEIFGPVLVTMTFRSHTEAVKLANNTKYGLAASIWTENINLALDIAPQIKAGSVWINCTNIFDAAAGFGGYKESGFGREGGKEGLYEYLQPVSEREFNDSQENISSVHSDKDIVWQSTDTIDSTIKLYIGGKQVRSDSGYSISVANRQGVHIGEIPKGNRKDIRNAVEAAHLSTSWQQMNGHSRAQILYYMAENLQQRQREICQKISFITTKSPSEAEAEFEKSLERLFYYAGWADKYDGHVHHTLTRYVTLAMPEKIGVLGIICPEEDPWLSMWSLILPAICMGNNIVVIPTELNSVLIHEIYQILDTSDVPAGTINIVTGVKKELAIELAKHYDVDGLWCFAEKELCREVEKLAAENLKRTWVNEGRSRKWTNDIFGRGSHFLRQASQIKNIWIPYGA